MLLLLAGSPYVRCQDSTLHIYIANDTVTLDQQFCLSVQVNNFDSIEAFQLSINFDPYLLDFDSISQMNQRIGLNSSFFGLQERNVGIVRVTYFDPFNSHTLADSAVLFDICFTAYGMPGELCPVNLADFPLPLEFISQEQIIPFSRDDARVLVEGGDALSMITSACKTGLIDSSGSFSVSIYGGNPPYFAIWQHTFNGGFSGGFGLDTFGQTFTVSNLIEGRYRISITDEDGNRIRDSLNIRPASDLFYATIIEHPICDNTFDGSIRIDSIRGGIVPPQFKWNDGQLFTTERDELAVGDYFVTITDPLGCRQSDTFELVANSIQTNIMELDETCLDAADGQFRIEINGGQPFDSLGYLIFYDSSIFYGTTFADSFLARDRYELTIADSIGCEKQVSIDIGSGLSFGLDSLFIKPVTCFGDSSAAIFIRPRTLTGQAILPYNFSWSGIDTARIDSTFILLENLPKGSYSITVTNEAVPGCAWDTTINIPQPPFLVVETVSLVPASCEPGDDGQARINIFGGRPDGDGNYLVLWDNGSDSIVGIDLSAGPHEVLVIDVGGCQVRHAVEIPTTDPPVLIGSSIRDIKCDSTPIGSILTIFSSPFGIESYAWSTGATTPSIDSIGPGIYTCIVRDRNGCVDTFDFIAAPPPGPQITELTIQNITCFGDTNGRLDVNYELGMSPLDRIEWNGVVGPDSLIELRSGGYEVIIYDTEGCSDTAGTTLVEPEPIQLQFIITDDTANMGTGSIQADVSGGWPPYEFAWSPGNLPDDSLLVDLQPGDYFLELMDANGCIRSDTAAVGFISTVFNGMPPIAFSFYPNPVSSTLHITGYHGTNATTFDMYNSAGELIHQDVLEESGLEYQIDLPNLVSGSYLIVLREANRLLFSGKLIKE